MGVCTEVIMKKYRVCHHPQVPCEPFIYNCDDLKTARSIEICLTEQHIFLFERNFIPDYLNLIVVQKYIDDEWVNINGGYT